jgi:hypothetical protein
MVDLTTDLAQYTGLLFLATALLVAATGALVCVGFLQVRDAKKSIAAAENAAKAAMKSAEVAEASLTVLERPVLVAYVRPFKVGYFTDSPGERTIFPKVGIDFTNYGKTPAIIDHAVADLILSRSPPDNSLSAGRKRLRWHIDVVRPGRHIGDLQVEAVGNPFSSAQKQEIQFRSTFVWFSGYVRFTDIFDALNTTYFMFKYEPGIDAFVRHRGDGQNRTERHHPLKSPAT